MRKKFETAAEMKAYEMGKHDANLAILTSLFETLLNLVGLWRPGYGVVDKLWLGGTEISNDAIEAIVAPAPGKWALGAVRIIKLLNGYPARGINGNLICYWRIGLVKWTAKA